jgi:ribosomal protein L30E
MKQREGAAYNAQVMTATEPLPMSERSMQSLRRHISALANLPECDAPVISAYFDLRRPIEALRAAFETWSVAARSTLPKQSRQLFDQAKADIRMQLKEAFPETIQGLAVFVRAGDHPLLMPLPFQASLETHFDVSSRPAVFPLVQMKDRFHRFVLVICAEETGRIIEMTLGAVTEEILTTRPDPEGRLGRQLSREHYHYRRDEDTRKFLKDKVRIIDNLMSRRGLNHLILAGHPRHVAQLKDHLPKHLQSRVVGTVFQSPNGRDYSPLLDQAIDTFIDVEQQESRSVVERLHEHVRRHGLAVVGIHACREVIEAGAASQLIISEELPHADREDLVRLATLHDLPIEVCERDELLQSHGGVGCLLRFRLEYLRGHTASAQ